MNVACPSCGAMNDSNAKFCSECGTHLAPAKGDAPPKSAPTQPPQQVMQPQPPITNKIYRTRNNKVFLGVCGGLAKHLNMDPDLVRILTVLLFLFTGGSILIAYIVAALLIPYDPNELPPQMV
ncbi:MAG: PspC domain-containing protein [Methanobacteriota archaeon]|nr:MAG: PspC domain-containing protein [Euryarchaeota archaeon]